MGTPETQGIDSESGRLSRDDILDKPWKYIGYNGFVHYCSSDHDFFALRRYDRLHCRILLMYQDKIAQLEGELEMLEDTLSTKASHDFDNGTLRKDKVEARKTLLRQVAQSLKEYDEMIHHYLSLQARPRASSWVTKNMRTWLSNNSDPIDSEEVKFLAMDDLIATSPSQKSDLRHFFEQRILSPTVGLFGFFAQKPGSSSSSVHLDPSTVHGRDEPVDRLAAVFVFIVAFGMLIAPLWILVYIDDIIKRLGVITAFITGLLAFLSFATLAKPFETLAVTAGYSAVLVVFLQIGSNLGASAS